MSVTNFSSFTSRKRKRSLLDDDVVQVDEKLDDIIEGLDKATSMLNDLKGKLDKVFVITKSTKVPFGLKQLILESLSCKICHQSPMKPPIIFALCCKTIIGCQTCVDHWYTTEERNEILSKSCPACRMDRGYSQTVRLRGLDDLLNGFFPLFEEDHD